MNFGIIFLVADSIVIIGFFAWIVFKPTPTHCDVCGCELEEYDYELYCPSCFRRAFEEEARLKRTAERARQNPTAYTVS